MRPPSGSWPSRATAGSVSINQGIWRFPDGSVLARTVSIEREPGKPASRRRMETQILHLEADAWRPYSYVWNDDQTDAVLADAARGDQDDRAEGARRPARAELPRSRPDRVRVVP